jgi:YbgC/YbaW family acyl-CoA thioester hydrolase
MTTPFRTTRRVEFADTDMAGIVHFSNFFRYMESAEVEYLRSLGLSVSFRTATGERFGFPRRAASCDYQRPALFQDVLEITVTVQNVGRKSVTYQFDFAKDGQPIARGQITAVCCRVVGDHQLVSIEIPENIRVLLEKGRATANER